MKNKKILSFFFSVLVFAVVITGWWFANFYFVKDLHQTIKQTLSNQGLTLDVQNHVVTGYPFYVKNVFYNATLFSPNDSNKTFAFSKLHVEKLVVVYPIWNPDNLNFSIFGSSNFVLKGGIKTFLINQDSLEGKIVLNKTKEVNLFLKNFQLVSKDGEKLLFVEEFKLLVHRFFLNKNSDTGEHFKVSFDFLFPDYYLVREVFPSARIENFQGQINIKGFFPLKNLPHSMRHWSQTGGFMEFENILLRLYNLESTLNGSLTLDQNLQPLLVSTLKIKGYRSLLDEMDKNQMISSKAKALVNIIVNFFARDKTADEGKAIHIALTVQDQWLSLGSFKMKEIPFINW